MSAITLEEITKRYPDGTLAVDSLSLDLSDGEFMILVGPSGCGKSTALRMVAGLEEISDGELRIGGERVNELPPKGRDIAMVFQNYALYPHMSVARNMGFALKMAKLSKAEIDRRVREAAEILDLSEHLERRPGQLSGGQRQRVAMGRAIVREPQAFLMDEPLSNLDAKLRVQTRAEIARIQKRLGTTTLYVTHDQTEAMTLGDRVAIMKSGVLQQVGSPRDLYDTPVNVFVAGFIGSPPMNLLPGELIGDGSVARTALGELPLPLPGGARPADGRVIVGVRPESFVEGAADGDAVARGEEIAVDAPVELSESLGSDVYLHLRLPGGEAVSELLIARLGAACALAPGDRAQLRLRPDALHVFAAADGRSLRA
ncbi:sn-glycerol-3-phosphate ABC transporter ATP-binding protein UgpC [Conexibacter stalactiti]|uniref:Sn-glycerol-3-phosphate ABC transporter ATP-binding protein UgpC n=1 Tax=Conexibacter stalactiti TaxID=1940611 RepID=A0ABU4HZ20_9ACTN|nr:sn-glycerol-3-phosphate ABC transporter ATP-binding protein UgpC [Conexibacter stalactiti]MDW5597952.1 sn-glycerol-3-phosphate ABC transporter ATP-binding protein UgpC [Conexibacter stalactiti]MEC5038594.1 sn-glycerol-3-phosphate ABC transporter ATP-binding protein UgpC [Conexibacter stalactiti]